MRGEFRPHEPAIGGFALRDVTPVFVIGHGHRYLNPRTLMIYRLRSFRRQAPPLLALAIERCSARKMDYALLYLLQVANDTSRSYFGNPAKRYRYFGHLLDCPA